MAIQVHTNPPETFFETVKESAVYRKISFGKDFLRTHSRQIKVAIAVTLFVVSGLGFFSSLFLAVFGVIQQHSILYGCFGQVFLLGPVGIGLLQPSSRSIPKKKIELQSNPIETEATENVVQTQITSVTSDVAQPIQTTSVTPNSVESNDSITRIKQVVLQIENQEIGAPKLESEEFAHPKNLTKEGFENFQSLDELTELEDVCDFYLSHNLPRPLPLLHLAAFLGDCEAIQELIKEHGIQNIKDRDSEGGGTPLHWAAWKGNIKACTLLNLYGCPLNVTDTMGATPLHWASWNGQTKFVSYFSSRGMNIHATDELGETPMHRAAIKNDQKTMTALFKKGGDILHSGNGGETPLDWYEHHKPKTKLSTLKVRSKSFEGLL